MPFSSFTSMADVARAYQITLGVEEFVRPRPVTVSNHFRARLDFVFANIPFRTTEFAVCESLIFPIVVEAWTPFADVIQLWCHAPLSCDSELTGIPDYFLARRSRLGKEVMEPPFLMLMEAKKDDFEWGWGQCLAAMVAAQKLNKSPSVVVQGIVATGTCWEFGKLAGASFVRDPRSVGLENLEHLLGSISFVIEQCRLQLASYAGAA
jgi:hypothetical protein